MISLVGDLNCRSSNARLPLFMCNQFWNVLFSEEETVKKIISFYNWRLYLKNTVFNENHLSPL